MDVILSTTNPSKALQIQTLFEDSGIRVRTLAEAGIEGEAVEDGATLRENAAKKAWYAHERADGEWVMADDSGIFIHALNDEPGVHSARWAGDVTTDEITQYCLKRLEGAEDRSAAFKTVVVVISPEGEEFEFTGEVEGRVLEVPRTKPQPRMPYSPLFVSEGEELCWAEMTTEHENRVSHRGKAFRKVRAFFESQA